MSVSIPTRDLLAAPLPAGRRKLVLWICCMSVLIVGIDQTIVNVALPSIQRGLHASLTDLQWVVAAYTLTVACLMMLSASLADRFGRRRVFQLGLGLFAAGSLLCSVAPNAAWLVVFRVIQAAGGSALNPVALSIISNTMADDAERARAFGLWGAIVGVSLAAGPVVGGVLVHTIGWRSIFWINVPIGAVAIALTQRFVPESRAERARRPDPPAQVLLLLSIGTLTTAIIEGQDVGWGAPSIVALFAVALITAIALVVVERRRREPLLDPRFFRSATFSGATLIAVASFGALTAFLFVNTLYLQTARGDDALSAGLLTLPMALMIFVFAQISGRLVARYGARIPFLFAGPAMAAGNFMLVALHTRTSIAYLLLAYVIFGIGMGLVNAPISNTAVSGMPRAQAGVAAAVASTGRLIGATLGVAVAGSLLAGSTGASFAGASHGAWIFIGGLGVFVLVAGLVSTSGWAKRTASEAAQLISDEDTSS